MQYRYEIDAERRLVTSHISGVVTLSELEEYRQRMVNDPAFNPDFDQLSDLREVTHSTLTGDQVRQFAMHSTFNRTSRRAMVARNNRRRMG